MKFFISLIVFGCVCALASAAVADKRVEYQQGQYYDGRYYNNRDYYNQRRHYDNQLKQYRPDVATNVARIVEQKLESAIDGNFAYEYETENGIHAEARGTSVNVVGSNEPGQKIEGSFAYISPEGLRVGVHYIADEAGYRPVYTFDGVNAAQYANVLPAADVEITKAN